MSPYLGMKPPVPASLPSIITATTLVAVGIYGSTSLFPARILSDFGVYNDHVFHFLFYAILATFLARMRVPWRYTGSLSICLALSCLTEWIQCYLPHRHGLEISDLAANSAGITCGLIFSALPAFSKTLRLEKNKQSCLGGVDKCRRAD